LPIRLQGGASLDDGVGISQVPRARRNYPLLREHVTKKEAHLLLPWRSPFRQRQRKRPCDKGRIFLPRQCHVLARRRRPSQRPVLERVHSIATPMREAAFADTDSLVRVASQRGLLGHCSLPGLAEQASFARSFQTTPPIQKDSFPRRGCLPPVRQDRPIQD